ncbi:MAG: hypothetical protein AAFO91_18185, partial [Bacteroidota bacterium]
MTSVSPANPTAWSENPWKAFNLSVVFSKERQHGQKWDFLRIEHASGTPKKDFNIEKVHFHGVGPLTYRQIQNRKSTKLYGTHSIFKNSYL